MEPTDELTALWEAALSEDGLLLDDELLNGGENPSTDPAPFFEDDGEGFLEFPQQSEQPDPFNFVNPLASPLFEPFPPPPIANLGTVSRSVPAPVPLAPPIDYILPSDGREEDPLQRWKGCPIFCWGFGGAVVTSFPKEVQRYTLSQALPRTKCCPGELSIRTAKSLFPLEEHIAKFPGPLRNKGKKKDVLTWLASRIHQLEKDNEMLDFVPIPADVRKRHEEKILLWKILQLLVEKDGVLEGTPEIEQSVRAILLPKADAEGGDMPFAGLADLSVALPPAAKFTPEIANSSTLETLRKSLLKGDREKAIWTAVDNRLWAHAMLIASTLNKDIWKQVTHEYIKSEVKTVGNNTGSLAALYEVFAGNSEESVDVLVHPSARAGLQMLSTASSAAAPTKNALEGLECWQETLSLILSNRSTDDSKALISLGKLLSDYGRIEAAHICYIFGRLFAQFGGLDDPQTCIVLVGADHNRQPFDFLKGLDCVLLTEIYEFALSLSASPTPTPHLLAYKLHHATVLAEHGLNAEADQYCESITKDIKSSTRPSRYYNNALFAELDDLSRRLEQASKDDSTSWIKKPSIEKVSNSAWARFNSFIAGEESDAVSISSGKEGHSDIGPFSRIVAATPPPTAQTPPNGDVYGAIYGEAFSSINGRVSPQYANKSSRYAPRSTMEHQNGYSPESISRSRYTPDIASEVRRGSSDASNSFVNHQNKFDSQKHSINTTQQPNKHMPSQNSAPLYSQSFPLPPQRQGSMGPPAPRTQSPYMPPSQYHLPPSRNPTPGASGSEGGAPPQRYHPPSLVHRATSSTYEPSALSSGLNISNSNSTATSHPAPTYEPPRSASVPPIPRPDRANSAYEPPSSAYEPSACSYIPSTSDYPTPTPGYESASSSYEPPTSGYEPPTDNYHPPTSAFKPPSNGYQPSATAPPTYSGYEPPTGSSYEPPSDLGYVSNHDSMDEGKPKKQFYMDDEDDDFAAKLKAKQARDKEADERFKKAAEEDAKKDSAAGEKKGWLGGWFGKKDPNAPTSGPIKAKLGEESSFYYDPELKKWVNKKAGATKPSTPSAPLAPPKGPPMMARAVSGPADMPSAPPPSGKMAHPPGPRQSPKMPFPPFGDGSLQSSSDQPSRVMTPPRATPSPAAGDMDPSLLLPSLATLRLDAGSAPPSAPSSRPNTSMSNASSIDDLLGPPGARKAGTVKKSKKNRYVDVMAQ